MFQSPQWGSNSKGSEQFLVRINARFQSPQWGSNSKAYNIGRNVSVVVFQSPQWGSNSKVIPCLPESNAKTVSVPAMGK